MNQYEKFTTDLMVFGTAAIKDGRHVSPAEVYDAPAKPAPFGMSPLSDLLDRSQFGSPLESYIAARRAGLYARLVKHEGSVCVFAQTRKSAVRLPAMRAHLLGKTSRTAIRKAMK